MLKHIYVAAVLAFGWECSALAEDVVRRYFTPIDPRPTNLWNFSYSILSDNYGELGRVFIRDGRGEQMVSLSKAENGQIFLHYAYFEQQVASALIRREEVVLSPKRIRKAFPEELAYRLNSGWTSELLKVGYPAEPPPLADGSTIYHFYAFLQWRGMLSGQTRVAPCPEDFEMIVVAKLLIDYAMAKTSEAEKKVIERAGHLIQKYPLPPEPK